MRLLNQWEPTFANQGLCHVPPLGAHQGPPAMGGLKVLASYLAAHRPPLHLLFASAPAECYIPRPGHHLGLHSAEGLGESKAGFRNRQQTPTHA